MKMFPMFRCFQMTTAVLLVVYDSVLCDAFSLTVGRHCGHDSSSGARCSTASSSSSSSSSTDNHTENPLFHRNDSHVFGGQLYPLQDTDESSFVSQMGVPTFAVQSPDSTRTRNPMEDDNNNTPPIVYRGLEGALQQGPAFVLDHVLSRNECREMIQTCETHGFGSYQAGKNHHGALQIMVPDPLVQSLATKIAPFINSQQLLHQQPPTVDTKPTSLVFCGLNRRWRIYRYAPGGQERFAPHIDAGFPPSGLSSDGKELIWDVMTETNDDTTTNKVVSYLTILFYLNDDFVGGETKFYQPQSQQQQQQSSDDLPPVIASVRPVTGSCLVFPQGVGEAAVDYARQHWPLHEGSPVLSGSPKYVIRSDLLFAATDNDNDDPSTIDPLSQYDNVVRQAFLPTSSVYDASYLHHIESLYNPHMGVENMGPFLYSFLRLTKRRRVVEIGAGYTSLWILQALKDNDLEMTRIRTLQRSGQCRLLDWPWTQEDIVEGFDAEPASLLCVDNCEHQKETATGASAIASMLGLSSYMQFIKGDAFELQLAPDTIDVLWCDFGVGSRMKDFVASSWSSIRPGGFLLCHSTVTNQRTREWLEAARSRAGEEITGLPPGEYVEVSLLEAHKHYQNSISIFQKRRDYTEPIYSEYA